ncbi:hypothetical protein CHS0354_012486 [Potamilus streckersoni]|uniref:Neurobeachin-like protein 1 n=1 Tax=Potamilus streckersoni TaxID=2493646 RepID=A0AAE0S0J6_9BIVA|nr:hypothetical protein CHS0354_012486 [Potamilus streckersoni]
METLSAREKLFQLWMIYSSKNDNGIFSDFIHSFIEAYEEFIDLDYNHLNEGFSEEGPHLTKLPDGILEVLGIQLCQHLHHAENTACDSLAFVSDLVRCLIVITRNYDNVPLISSCEFVSYCVNIGLAVLDKICAGGSSEDDLKCMTEFLKLIIHFFECLYDPYFTWRKRLKGWNAENSRIKYKPALLHVEVIPFFYDCFSRRGLQADTQLRLLHMFGGMMSGSQTNALKAITPATLDVVLKILSVEQHDKPTNEQRKDSLVLKSLVLKCIVKMVHVIHCCSPDQRQVEVSQVMEGYMKVLLETDLEQHEGSETHLQLSMTSAINEMLACQDKAALQVILVSGGTFDSFISLLQKTSLCGLEAQSLAMSVLNVLNTVLTGSSNAKERFKVHVGYERLVESLKCIGQPSVELLKSVLNLVLEGTYDEKHESHTVHNTQAAMMLIQWLPDIQSHDLQIWLSENLRSLCTYGHNNKMNCCKDGLISAILTVLGRERQINSKAVGNLIGLLEGLGTHSITATDLKQLISLLKLNEEENQNAYSTRLMRAISTMARREGKEGALRFFNLQEPTDGISLPGIRKWPGSCLSFHTWLCLDTDVDSRVHNLQPNQLYRRQLYSFASSSGCGFEAFFTVEKDLVIAVYNRKEFSSLIVPDLDLCDSHWHSVDIVQTSSKRPFVNSQLYVYIDGKFRLNSQFKFPNMSEPLTSCRVGSPGFRNSLDALLDVITAPSSPSDNTKISPLKLLIQQATKSRDSVSVSTIPVGTQDEIWGPPVTLHGQMGQVCIFHDALQPSQVKALYTAGPNHLTLFSDDSELSDLPGKLLVHYNAKACKSNQCIDLSGNQNHGQLNGQKCVTWDIKDVINCIGGIQVLFPLLEQVNRTQEPIELASPDVQELKRLFQSQDHEDWVVLPSSSYADKKLQQNQVAGFLTLLRNMMQTHTTNQDTFVRTSGAATLSALLQKVNPKLIDVHVLMAIQLLVEATAATNKVLLNHLYQNILFDFRIWSKSDFPVRIGHIQYLSTIIKDDRRHFRKIFGVQYMLDVIRSHYSSRSGLSEEDAKTIRVSLLNLIKYYVAKEITYDELNSMVSFIITVRQEDMICEILDIFLSLLESSRKQDQLYLLLFEQQMADMFYGLLALPGYTIVFYEKIIKVLCILLKTDRVYEKSKNRLRLLDCGYLGLVGLMQGCEVSVPTIKRFLEQVSITDTSHSYNAVLAVLQLIQSSGFDIKLAASQQVLSILVSKTGAAKQFAKQLGWQEAFTKLFILSAISKEASDHGSSDLIDLTSDVFTMSTDTQTTKDQDSIAEGSDVENRLDIDKDAVVESTLTLHSSSCSQSDLKTISPDHTQFHLNLGNVDIALGSSPQVPLTPLFEKMNQDLLEDDLPCDMSRSSSASAEDLSTLGQRSSQQRHPSDCLSTSLSVTEESLETTSQANESRRDSFTQAEHIQRALDSLGLQRIYVGCAEETSEELCQNLLIILLTVMWKGMDGSDKTVWLERGQVFSWLDYLSQTSELIRPAAELKRRLLEMMLHSCTSDMKEPGQYTASMMENSIELVRITRAFVVDKTCSMEDRFSERFLEDVMSLLDTLAVWDVNLGTQWQEMIQLGLSILLAFAQHPHIEMCSLATARLHMLIQTKLISSSAEAAFLIGNLNDVISKAIDENTDNYSFLIPVMKALIDKAFDLMNLDLNLPNLPSTSLSPTFFDDFKVYCRSKEWRTFLEVYVTPQKEHFVDSAFQDSLTTTQEFWKNCHEEMMVNLHKKNRERGESKLKFQSLILEGFNKKVSQEERRFVNVTIQMRNQHSAALRQWRATKRFFTGERGAWAERCPGEIRWKLSNQENFSRMKVRLIQNYNFDSHLEASRLRDNLGVPDIAAEIPLEKIAVSKEALVAKDSIADDVIGDEDWNAISNSSGNVEEYQDKEKLVLAEACELVTLINVVEGRLEITNTHVYFFDCSSNKEEGGEDFKWSLSQLREIHFRRYNLRRSALELFLIDQTNYFLNFQQKDRNKVYSRIVSLRPPNLISYQSRSPAELLKSSGLVQKWVQHEISNFEYLMQLNTIAGRTYNDLSQYPVFPWILSDYTSEELDLENPAVFRDLSKPIGVVNPKNEQDVREKYEHFEDPSGVVEKFHYGTHYSNAAGVMHYMIRMEPFTTLHINLQSGRFDVADRQFHSIPATWKSIYDNPNDVKELIPEFFYLPDFLDNMNNFDLGRLQISKERVNDVLLPKWAKSSEDFIHKHRKALESECVSRNLHHWIDLIFGYKQKGPAAVEALNVFYYCTYEGAVDLDAIQNPVERKALEGMINNFGQTPCRLLKEPHPQRMSFEEVVTKAMKTDRHLSVFDFVDQLKLYFVEVSTEKDPLVYVSVPRNQARSIIQHGMSDTMVTVTDSGIIGTHGWLPYDKNIPNYFTFDKDPSTANPKSKKKLSCPFAPGLKIDPKLFVVSHDAKLLFSGGHWDNSVQVFHLGKGKKVNHIVRHIDIVTCLSLDYCGSHLITGSRDTTCMIWQVQQQNGINQNLCSKPVQILYGHDAEVTAVHISIELDMAVSAAKDKTVIIHTVRKGHYMRTIHPFSEPGYVLNIPLLAVDDMGHVIVYCHETLPIDNKEILSLHVYSINGKHLFSEKPSHRLGHMMVKGDYLLTGDTAGVLKIWEIFGLKNLTSVALLVPIHSLAVTNGNSHILAGLQDGKLIIIGIKNREIR